MATFWEVLKSSIMITVFVFVMMLIVEYINIFSKGKWQKYLSSNKWSQYILCSFLGATPGCLGAFVVVTMYSHRIVSLGALTAAMIATSGDEAFVMLAMFPRQAFYLTIILFITGVLAGFMTDSLCRNKLLINYCPDPVLTHNENICPKPSAKKILNHLRHGSLARTVLMGFLILSFALIISGTIGENEWGWRKITVISLLAVSFYIIISSPEHFLEVHLWKHVAKKHVPRIFMWTFGALLAIHIITDKLYLGELIKNSKWFVLWIAGLIGIIPDSGPHLIFVTMFSKNLIPFSILLTNSIIQDGHGMLPLLGFSRRAFFTVKIINIIVGFAIGATLLYSGF
ncbi:MAG: arsenic efflux protein [Oligoflexia bacterium]|nr:arsenic efflux protein [Oligoflexia bacterium]